MKKVRFAPLSFGEGPGVRPPFRAFHFYPLREMPGCKSDLQLLDDHLLLSLLISMSCSDQIDPRMEW